MNYLQNTKLFNAIPPAAIKDNAAFSALVLDKTEFDQADYMEFIVTLGSIDATMAVLKVMESDTKTNDTTLGGTPTEVLDVTTKPGATDDDKVAVIGVDLTASRKRYLQLQATAGDGAAGTFLSAVAVVSRPQEGSSKAADREALFAEYA